MRDNPWTSAEIDLLRRNAHRGVHECAELLNRSVGSVRQAAHRNRISLRKTNSRRGLLLGQPRGTRWADLRQHGLNADTLQAIRADALDGTVDLAVLEQQVVALSQPSHLPLCPSCVSRPQARPTGLCLPCHLRHLAAAHREDVTTRAAFREYELARQQKHRAKKGDNDD